MPDINNVNIMIDCPVNRLEFYTPVFSDLPSAGNGGVTFSAPVGVKVLFITKEWELYKSDKLNLFVYGDSPDVLNDSRQDQSYRQQPCKPFGSRWQ